MMTPHATLHITGQVTQVNRLSERDLGRCETKHSWKPKRGLVLRARPALRNWNLFLGRSGGLGENGKYLLELLELRPGPLILRSRSDLLTLVRGFGTMTWNCTKDPAWSVQTYESPCSNRTTNSSRSSPESSPPIPFFQY